MNRHPVKMLAAALVAGSLVFSGCSCSSEQEIPVPSIEQVRKVAELTTLRAYFNNVVEEVKEPGTGILHWGEVERKYWLRYTGIVDYKIDVSKIVMDADQNARTVNLTIPYPEITVRLDESAFDNDEPVIASNDNFLNKNEITRDDQKQAFAKADQEMHVLAKENTEMAHTAQSRAYELIKAYIDQLTSPMGVNYSIYVTYEPQPEEPESESGTSTQAEAPAQSTEQAAS